MVGTEWSVFVSVLHSVGSYMAKAMEWPQDISGTFFSVVSKHEVVKPVVVVIQLLSCVSLFVTPWTAACQASLSIIHSRSLLKFMFIKLGMPSNHLILCGPRLLQPSMFPSIRVLSSKSVLRIRWPKCWRFSFSISPSNEYSGLISIRMDWISFQLKGLSRVFSNTTVQKHQFFGTQPNILSVYSNSHIHTWPLEKP